MGLQDDGKHLIRGGIGLGNDTPHAELVQDFYESLTVVLTQGGIKLPYHCQLDFAHFCNACHGSYPLSRD